MKKRWRSLNFFLFVFPFFLFAKITQELGKDSYGKEVLSSLELQGAVKLHGTKIEEKTKVLGALIAHEALLKELDVTGDLQLFSSKIEGSTHAIGAFRAESCSFQETIYFSGKKASFSQSTLEKGIVFEKEFGFKGSQILELKNKSQVYGKILFEDGKGQVHLYPGVKLPSQIEGAEVIYK